MTYNDGDDKLILKVFLNSKKVSIASTCDGLEKNIYISDYTNKNDKNYKTFKKYYDKISIKQLLEKTWMDYNECKKMEERKNGKAYNFMETERRIFRGEKTADQSRNQRRVRRSCRTDSGTYRH